MSVKYTHFALATVFLYHAMFKVVGDFEFQLVDGEGRRKF